MRLVTRKRYQRVYALEFDQRLDYLRLYSKLSVKIF